MENLKRQKEQEALNRAVENYVKNLEAHAKVKIYGSSGSAK
jgi:predicted LPLAT superfamily acyltransferase